MSEQPEQPQQYSEKYEKEEEKGEKEHEKEEEKSWEEKWRQDPLGAAIWACILIWAGVVLLADNLDMIAFEWFDTWGFIFLGAGVAVFLGIVARILLPSYRRPVGGSLVLGAIFLGIGLGMILNTALVFPFILIAIGLGILLRGFGFVRQ